MADITAAPAPVAVDPKFGETFRASWTFTESDTPLPVSYAEYSDRTVQVRGTYGGATIAIHGSLDGTNYVVLHDTEGNALSFTSGDNLKSILEATPYIKPVIAGGSSTAIVVTLFGLRYRF